jgi:hypothetical protein
MRRKAEGSARMKVMKALMRIKEDLEMTVDVEQ